MKINLCFIDRNHSEHSFYATQILSALNIDCVITVVDNKAIINELLSDGNNIMVVNYSNNIIQAEDFVELVMRNGCKATLLCTADTDRELFRFLPARPFALLRYDNFENDLTESLKNTVVEISKVREKFIEFHINGGMIMARPSEISCFEAGKLFLTTGEVFEITEPKSSIKKLLESECFLWIDSECVININNVKSIDRNCIVLNSDKKILAENNIISRLAMNLIY